MAVYTPGTLVQARRRLWRVDSQDGDVLYLTAVDESSRQTRLFLPFEMVSPASYANLTPTRLAHRKRMT